MAYGESYDEFVAKFSKPRPKTTDDCYTGSVRRCEGIVARLAYTMEKRRMQK